MLLLPFPALLCSPVLSAPGCLCRTQGDLLRALNLQRRRMNAPVKDAPSITRAVSRGFLLPWLKAELILNRAAINLMLYPVVYEVYSFSLRLGQVSKCPQVSSCTGIKIFSPLKHKCDLLRLKAAAGWLLPAPGKTCTVCFVVPAQWWKGRGYMTEYEAESIAHTSGCKSVKDSFRWERNFFSVFNSWL